MLSCFEQEKSFMTSGPGFSVLNTRLKGEEPGVSEG